MSGQDLATPWYSPRIVSGMRPVGGLHIGHFFGATLHHLHLQHQFPGEMFFFVADLHSLSTGKCGKLMELGTLEVVSTYLALGLDPKKAVIYRQSDVLACPYLACLLAAHTPARLLTRMPPFRQAKRTDRKSVV